MEKENVYYATGKRKSAIARTWIMPGNGEITINDSPMDDYFKVEVVKTIIKQPLVLTNTLGSFDVKAHVTGGGFSGQAGAIRRDARVKERKKDGQKGARARFQFSKR
jgi:small subunit ribosomal protein S9